VTLAMFHTVFNILGVLIIFPFNRRLAHFLDRRFVTQEEIEGRPRFLDKTVAVSPVLAVNALALELSRITTVVRRMALEALSSEFDPSVRIRRDFIVARKLSSEVAKFITHLERGMLNQETSEQLTKVLRTDQHLLACADQALEIARMQADVEEVTDEKVNDGISHYRAEVVNLLTMANPEQEGFSFSCCEAQLDEVQMAYDAIKADLLQAGAELRIPIPVMIDILEQNSRIRRIPRQMVKAMHHLSELSMITDVRVSESESDSDDEVESIALDSSLTEQK
jgi:phosphate:Na+ symporter